MQLSQSELSVGSAATDVSLAKTASSVRAWAWRLVPPVACFVVARVFLSFIAAKSHVDGMQAGSWARWDSAHYLSIAQRGYEFFSCARLPGYDPAEWCGTAAWMPGYPLAIRALTYTGLSLPAAGALLSAAAGVAALGLVWNAFLSAKPTLPNCLTLLLAAFFPGHIYDHAIFPVSLFIVLQLLSLHAYAREQYAQAGLSGALAAFTYSSGLFLAGVYGLHVLLAERRRPYSEQLRIIALTSGGVVLGFAAVLTMQRLQVGVWNAYFLVQHKYHYDPQLPFAMWIQDWKNLRDSWPHVAGLGEQRLVVLLMATSMLFWLRWRRSPERHETLLATFLVVYWLTPLMMGGQLSLHRAEATLLPAVPLARHIPVPLLLGLLGGALVLSKLLAKLFFISRLV